VTGGWSRRGDVRAPATARAWEPWGVASAPAARYDGPSDFYDRSFGYSDEGPGSLASTLAALLGPVTGWCLDVGCGTGLSGLALARAGWRVGGLDLSADQLRLAKPRLGWVVRGDAQRLPFASASIERIAAMFVHTDLDDVAAMLAEVARVLRDDGTLAYLGVHPCFVGPHIEGATGPDDELRVAPGYRRAEWIPASEFRSERYESAGLRQRVGARHVPLSDLVNAFTAAGLLLDTVVEAGDGIVPWVLGLRARKPARR
jgi:SAM-dependent methyltransferase